MLFVFTLFIIFYEVITFCVKPENAFISESVPDRTISTAFLTHRVSLECTGNFSQGKHGSSQRPLLSCNRKRQKV